MAERIRADCRLIPGTASDFIEHLQDLLGIHPTVVLYCRVSTVDQKRAGNLDHQVAKATADLAAWGITPIDVFADVESSRMNDYRPLLDAAIACASRHNAIFTAAYRNRIIRSWHWRWGVPLEFEPPTAAEYQLMLRRFGSVVPTTLLHPDDATAHSEQTKAGQRGKGNKGGRPRQPQPGYKKAQKEEWGFVVNRLRELGYNDCEIAKEIKKPRSTIQRW